MKSLYNACENVGKPKEKFKVYVLDFGDSTDIMTENKKDITDWIGSEIADMKEGEEHEYKITIKMLTRRQINNLPEWS